MNEVKHQEKNYVVEYVLSMIAGTLLTGACYLLIRYDLLPVVLLLMWAYFIGGYLIGKMFTKRNYFFYGILFGISPLLWLLFYKIPDTLLDLKIKIIMGVIPLGISVLGAMMGSGPIKKEEVQANLDGDIEENKSSIIKLQRAKFADRFWASLYDSMIFFIPMIIVIIMLALIDVKFLPNLELFKNKYFLAFIKLIGLTINLGYFALYAYYHDGQTIGKLHNKIKVVDLAGNRLSLNKFILRELVAYGIPALLTPAPYIGKVMEYWTLTYLLALTKERRALHDIIAGSQVIKLG